jgi:hypothetical protein
MMRYFFNDVEVTETEYKELITKSTPDVPDKFVMAVPAVRAVTKPKPMPTIKPTTKVVKKPTTKRKPSSSKVTHSPSRRPSPKPTRTTHSPSRKPTSA